MTPATRTLLLAILAWTVLGSGFGSGFGTGAARAEPALVADLSDHLIAIETDFAGRELLLFGSSNQPGDVVVVVRGPERSITMRRQSRVVGIWMNTATLTFRQVPAFYSVASNLPLEEIAPEAVRERNQLGIENLDLALPTALVSPNLAEEWREALIRAQMRQGYYGDHVQPIEFLGHRLFRARIFFPANVPSGLYRIETYLIRDGQVVGAQTTPLVIGKVGLEADIFDFAHQQSALYGIGGIIIALLAGWLANLAFRRS